MKADATIKQGFFFRHRYWIMAAGILLFLPPLSFIFQFTQDSSFCGSWCPRMFFTWRRGVPLDDFLLGFVRSYAGVALVAGVLASTFIFGRYWCSHICPIGGSMELSSRVLPKFMKINYKSVPAPSFRYGYLLMYFLLPALGIGSLCCNYCNFATIPRLFGAAFTKADMAYFFRTAGLINLGLMVMLGVAAKGGRAYCNLLCPIGALDSLVNAAGSRLGFRRVRVDKPGCIGCGKCEGVCPTWAISMDADDTAKIDQFSCMPCGRCEGVCPEGAIANAKAGK